MVKSLEYRLTSPRQAMCRTTKLYIGWVFLLLKKVLEIPKKGCDFRSSYIIAHKIVGIDKKVYCAIAQYSATLLLISSESECISIIIVQHSTASHYNHRYSTIFFWILNRSDIAWYHNTIALHRTTSPFVERYPFNKSTSPQISCFFKFSRLQHVSVGTSHSVTRA